MSFLDHLSSSEKSACLKAFVGILYCPIAWNFLARLEYNTHFLTRLFGGWKYPAAYALAFYIFTSSLVRDSFVNDAIEACRNGPLGISGFAFLATKAGFDFLPLVQIFGFALEIVGLVLVLSSMWKLGITGTYLGDYFGILLPARVESFPFNVMEHPMYDGASMVFLGQALVNSSLAGTALSAVVFITYRVSTHFFEGPFTAMIYDTAARSQRRTARAAAPRRRTSSAPRRR